MTAGKMLNPTGAEGRIFSGYASSQRTTDTKTPPITKVAETALPTVPKLFTLSPSTAALTGLLATTSGGLPTPEPKCSRAGGVT